MKINADRTAAGFAAENNDKQTKLPQNSKSVVNEFFTGTKDDLELTSGKPAVLNQVGETNVWSASSAQSGAGDMDSMKQLLSRVSNYIHNNPAEALSAQANLNSETVAGLIG